MGLAESPLSSESLIHMKSTGNKKRFLRTSTAPINPMLSFDNTSPAPAWKPTVRPNAPTVPCTPAKSKDKSYGGNSLCPLYPGTHLSWMPAMPLFWSILR